MVVPQRSSFVPTLSSVLQGGAAGVSIIMDVGGTNWIKNPGNDPERVAGDPNWIKNPENNPEKVVGRLNWIRNPENNPAREEVTGRLQSGWSGISRRNCYLCNKRKVQWKVTISE